MPAPASPLVAGRYALREVLAVGGMSTVHLAEDLEQGREVALKVFRTEADPLATDRLRQEGELLARLEHPNLVRAFAAGSDEDGGNAWLALELLAGPNVAVALHRNGPFPPADVRRLLEHVAGALAYIHARGIVHRDVKPSNVLLTADPATDPDWQAKLADFGIAMQVEAGRVLVGDAPVGTAAYFSPEQTLGHPVATSSDVYSLGLVALEALTGERAFPGGAIESATARLFRQPTLPDWLDDGWRALLETMTARDPRARPTAEQVRAACASLATAPSRVAAGAAQLDWDVRTEPATLLAPALLAAVGPVPEPAVPDPAPVGILEGWRRRLQPGFADRLSRRALVAASAGVLVLSVAAGGTTLMAAAPAAPIIPLEQALPAASPVVPTPRAEDPAAPQPRATPTTRQPVLTLAAKPAAAERAAGPAKSHAGGKHPHPHRAVGHHKAKKPHPVKKAHPAKPPKHSHGAAHPKAKAAKHGHGKGH